MENRRLFAWLSVLQDTGKTDSSHHEMTSIITRYGFAVAAVAASLGLSLGLTWWVGPGLSAYLTFSPAVMMAALFAGFWPGIVATALSALLVIYWVIPPIGQLFITPRLDRIELLIFACLGIFMSVVAQLYRISRAKAAIYDREAALREGQARLAVFAAASFEGIVESEAGRIVDCNEQFAQMLGYSVSDLRGIEFAELIPEEERDRVTANIVANRDSTTEHAMRRKDGTRLIVEAHGRSLSPGSAKRHTAVRDITVRKKAEEALLLSSERLRQTVRVAGLGIFDHDHLANTVEWSSELRTMIGFDQDEVSTLAGWISHVHPEDRARVVAAIHRAHDPGSDGVYSIEHRLVRNDGSIRWVIVRSQTFFAGNADERRPVRTIGAVRDITEQRESEAQIARELQDAKLLQSISVELVQKEDIAALHEKLLAAAEHIMQSDCASIQMFCPDDGGKLRLLGFQGVDAHAAKNWEWVDKSVGRSTCSEALRTGRRVIMPDLDQCDFMGTEDRAWFQQTGIHACQTTPLVSRGGRLVGMISTHWRVPHVPTERELRLFDVLARQAADLIENEQAAEALRAANSRLEQMVQKRTAQLSERAAQLRALAGQITVSEQRERQRLAQVLHDGLQQILVGAKLRLDVASRSQDIRPKLAQIGALIDDAIATSRSLTAELSPTVLLRGDLLGAMEWLAQWMHEKYELDVRVTARRKIDILTQDVILTLFQAVRELLFNVVKHARVKTAHIRLHQLDGKILINVEDKGAGFDPKQLHATEVNSHGLGLFSLSERISHMNGRFRIRSAPGQGSRFTLSVPYAPTQSRMSSAEPMHLPASYTQAEPFATNYTRIMLVDDHQVMRQGLAGLLRLEPGFEVVGEAADGQTAIALAREMKPDIVLMDVSMPGMDGIAATRIIHREQPQIRIIGLSMFNADEQAAAMREAGAVDYVTKSGPSERLIEAIRSCTS